MEDMVKMFTKNEGGDKPLPGNSFSSYKKFKPVIVDIDMMSIDISKGNFNSLEKYLKSKDMIQSTYEDANTTSQKFVIPKLLEMKRKYYPSCCENVSRLERHDKEGHKSLNIRLFNYYSVFRIISKIT